MVRIRFFSNSLWNNGLVKRLLLLVFMNPLSFKKNSRTHHNAILVPAIKNTKMIFGRESLLKMCKNTSRKCQDFPRNVLFPKFLFSPFFFFFFFFHYNLLFYNYLPGILSKLQPGNLKLWYTLTQHTYLTFPFFSLKSISMQRVMWKVSSGQKLSVNKEAKFYKVVRSYFKVLLRTFSFPMAGSFCYHRPESANDLLGLQEPPLAGKIWVSKVLHLCSSRRR